MNEETVSKIIDDIAKQYKGIPFRKEGKPIRRNETCPCGSGVKFKKCCLLTKRG